MLDSPTDIWNTLLAIPHLGLVLALVWLVYLFWLGGWIVLQKRQPAATISWLLGLALLPYVGFLVYYFFGPRRIHRQRLRRQRSRARLLAGDCGDDPECRELARLAQATTGLAPTTAREVRLLVDGGDKYEALLADIAAARAFIHLEYYIWAPDRIGTRLRDALIARARASVTVRLLLDAVGSAGCRESFLKPLREAGGEVAWFHPPRVLRFWQRPWLNLRSHRKIVVIDGVIGYIGGMNVTDDEDERDNPMAYHDLHLRLVGDAVVSLQRVFVDDWAYASGSAPSLPPPPPPNPGAIPAQVLPSGPDSPWEAIFRMHVAAIHSAQTRVWLMTPYFVPVEAGMLALTSAGLSGLDVRVLLPRMSDSRLVTYAARSYFDDLLAAGVKVYEYGPRLMHAKALLVDDNLVLIGSANFDNRSFRLNFEASMLLRDADIGQQLATVFERALTQAPRVQLDRHRPLWRARLPEALARLLAPLL